MGYVETRLLEWYPLASEAWSLVHPRGLLSGSKPGTSRLELSKNARAFFIRKDNGEPNTKVNVFDVQGNKVYTIERTSRNSTLWSIYEAATRVQLARIECGLFTRSVTFLNNPEVKKRQIGQPRWLYCGLPGRRFYLTDGAPLEWSRSSQYLERVINPGGGPEETRERLALCRLLRPRRFDWELLVDPSLDEQVALATVFISLLTEWSTWKNVVPGARSP